MTRLGLKRKRKEKKGTLPFYGCEASSYPDWEPTAMQREDVINVFKSEFNPILEKFIVIDISVSEASDSIAEHVS